MPPVRPRTPDGSDEPAPRTCRPRLLTGWNTTLLTVVLAWSLAACGLLDDDPVDTEPTQEREEESPADPDEGAAAAAEEGEPELDPDAWSPWAMPAGDAGAANRARLPGPEQPGLRWWLDLGEVETGFAPEGYDSIDARVLLADAGVLIARVSNPEEQYEETARFRNELIGIDLDTAEVRWEIPNVSPVNSDPCMPGLDRQDRIWVEQRPGGGDRVVAAFDPVTGEPTGAQIAAEDQRCRAPVIIGGEQERMVFSTSSAEDLRMFDVSGAEPTEIDVALADRDDVGSLLNHGDRDHWAVMTSDHLVTLIEIVDDDGDGTEHRIVSVALEDGTTTDEITLPTAAGIDSTEVDRAYLLADDDRVYLSTRRTGDSQVLAIDATDGDLTTEWEYDLEVRAPELTLGDGVVLFQDGRRSGGAAPPITALDSDDGTLVFDDGEPVGAQPLANPDGTLFGRTSAEDSTRMRKVSRIGADGQPRWQLPWSELAQTRGQDPEDPERPFVEVAGVDEQGTLLLVSDDGDGVIIALEREGELRVAEPSSVQDDG